MLKRNMDLTELVALSRFYGANTEYVIAGGGNTSLKDGSRLFIKGSGTALADITACGFVGMDREKLAKIWEKTYPEKAEDREAAVLADMMAAKLPGEEHKRPSVETLLHDILPFTWVVHTHPALVNGLTCSVRGAEEARSLFGEKALWIPETNPGYILSQRIKDALGTRGSGTPAAIILLQNHGVFVGADTPEGIKSLYRYLMDTLGAKITEEPDFSGQTREYGPSAAAAAILAALAGNAGSAPAAVLFERNRELAALVEDASAFYPVSSAFTPDHIVYSGSSPLFIETGDKTEGDMAGIITGAWKNHLKKTGIPPKIAALRGIGVFGIGPSEKAARLALELFTDTVKVAVFSRAFGGPRFMAAEKIDFINNWEVERYRSGISGSIQEEKE
ncbi:MAG: class II aldolase/adducin family protein [Spirochaetaceae bacterium]|jgi:rhamnose utilization protein RhaD (predicted bifunctional aldolase and dehydrogenase)|nr:class II aldolase/adducin family protein [Spirochaetaceae bacterium]